MQKALGCKFSGQTVIGEVESVLLGKPCWSLVGVWDRSPCFIHRKNRFQHPVPAPWFLQKWKAQPRSNVVLRALSVTALTSRISFNKQKQKKKKKKKPTVGTGMNAYQMHNICQHYKQFVFSQGRTILNLLAWPTCLRQSEGYCAHGFVSPKKILQKSSSPFFLTLVYAANIQPAYKMMCPKRFWAYNCLSDFFLRPSVYEYII